MKKYIWLVIALAAVVAVIMLMPGRVVEEQPERVEEKQVGLADSPANARYTFTNEGSTPLNITLTDGASVVTDGPEAGLTITTEMFGEPAFGDLDGDGDTDGAVFLWQQSGGTGTFYYAAAAINMGGGYIGSNTLFLGDRIAPQTIEIKDGILIANYADRAADDPFSAAPSIGISLRADLENGTLVKK